MAALLFGSHRNCLFQHTEHVFFVELCVLISVRLFHEATCIGTFWLSQKVANRSIIYCCFACFACFVVPVSRVKAQHAGSSPWAGRRHNKKCLQNPFDLVVFKLFFVEGFHDMLAFCMLFKFYRKKGMEL